MPRRRYETTAITPSSKNASLASATATVPIISVGGRFLNFFRISSTERRVDGVDEGALLVVAGGRWLDLDKHSRS